MPGDIIDEHGEVIGQHDGAFFYTIGQRQGLGVGGGKPYYVYQINAVANQVHVTTDPTSAVLNTSHFALSDCIWFSEPIEGKTYDVQVRYRTAAKPGKVHVSHQDYMVTLDQAERAVTPGQSAVIYDGEVVLGGGIIA